MELRESLRPAASFIFKNTASESKRIALFAGHYDTSEVVFSSASSNNAIISHANPEALVQDGYNVDQVADDYNKSVTATSKGSGTYPIQVTSKRRTRMVDFMNYVKYSGSKVTKIRITDLSKDSEHPIFNGEIEVSQSAIGKKGGSDYIQLSTHIDPRNFNQGFIDIDLEEQSLLLDETTVVIMDVCASANFQIDYILA